MSRPIKFRAWHKKRKRMYEVLILHMETLLNGGIWATVKGRDVIDQKDIHVQIQPKDIIVMQYTGLKDRNGKEIYEGDKLLHPNKQIYEVIWRNLGWTIKDEIRGFIGWHPDVMEVIGNIYETPLEDTP